MSDDLDEYYDGENDEYECLVCEALYGDRETFRLHVEYCGESS